MDYLRQLFETIGFSNVETFIASGNVIFDSRSKNTRALEQKIEGVLAKTLGYAVATFIRTTSELANIAVYKPFSNTEVDTDGNVIYIAFVPDNPNDQAITKLMSLRSEVDDFHVYGREVYWLCRTKFSESAFSGARLEKSLGMPATFRNSTTVRKIASKYS